MRRLEFGDISIFQIPEVVMKEFTFDHVIPIQRSYFNQFVIAKTKIWTFDSVENARKSFRDGTMKGTYGFESIKQIQNTMKHVNIKGAKVLVIGSRVKFFLTTKDRGDLMIVLYRHHGLKQFY